VSLDADISVWEGTSSPEDAAVEIVERKGLGHPDTICDAVAEHISCALSRAYLERTGAIEHFNCDKLLLIAGRAETAFGGGRVLEPIRLVLGDRATSLPGLSVDEVAIAAAQDWFRQTLRYVDASQHVLVRSELRSGSAQLRRVATPGPPLANDTSVGVGFAPLTETERLVLLAERPLNDPVPAQRRRWVGEDVKILGVRRGRQLALTVAVPLVDRHVESEARYFELKRALADELHRELQVHAGSLELSPIDLNTLDRPGQGAAGVYLTVTGTSAEGADSGEVGRGNRANGLITFNRPMSLEAAAGKNPAYHVGKIYSVLAQVVAEHLRERVPGVRSAVIWMWSRIGSPISEPAGVSMQLIPERGTSLARLREPAVAAVHDELARVAELCRELAEGKRQVF